MPRGPEPTLLGGSIRTDSSKPGSHLQTWRGLLSPGPAAGPPRARWTGDAHTPAGASGGSSLSSWDKACACSISHPGALVSSKRSPRSPQISPGTPTEVRAESGPLAPLPEPLPSPGAPRSPREASEPACPGALGRPLHTGLTPEGTHPGPGEKTSWFSRRGLAQLGPCWRVTGISWFPALFPNLTPVMVVTEGPRGRQGSQSGSFHERCPAAVLLPPEAPRQGRAHLQGPQNLVVFTEAPACGR